MAHSYIDFNSRYKHFQDEYIVWLMAAVMKESVSLRLTPELSGLFSWWSSRWHTFGPGCVELPLDMFLCCPDSIEQFITILEAIESNLISSGPIVTATALAELIPQARFQFGDQPREPLLSAITNFKELLRPSPCEPMAD